MPQGIQGRVPTVCPQCRTLTAPVGANLAVCGRCDRIQVVPEGAVERPWLANRRR